MHFWSLYFGPILILVSNLISCLLQSLKMKTMTILVLVVNLWMPPQKILKRKILGFVTCWVLGDVTHVRLCL